MGRAYSTIPWLLQCVSGAVLAALLIIHFWTGHYADFGEPITFAGVQTRLQDAAFIILDSLLLVTVVFHGLNGLGNILLDYPSLLPRNGLVSFILLVIGIATIAFGIYSLYPFVGGS